MEATPCLLPSPQKLFHLQEAIVLLGKCPTGMVGTGGLDGEEWGRSSGSLPWWPESDEGGVLGLGAYPPMPVWSNANFPMV